MPQPTPLAQAIVAELRHAQRAAQRTAQSQRPAAPTVVCQRCRDLGFVRRNLPPHHPDFGRAQPCPDCHDARQIAQLAAQMAARWPVGPGDQRKARRAFLSRSDAPAATDAYRHLVNVTQNALAGQPIHDLLALHGPPGVGKSHLCLIAWGLASNRGQPVIYTTATALQERWQRFGHDTESRREADLAREGIRTDLVAASLLILDEADRIHGDWIDNQLLQIFNARRGSGRTTIVAGNNLHTLPDTLVSRLRGGRARWVDLSTVPDARPALDA